VFAQVQRVHNADVRLLLNTKKTDHITDGLKDLHWLPIYHSQNSIQTVCVNALNNGGQLSIVSHGHGQSVVFSTYTMRPQIARYGCI
jgi:hypothetical protein